MILVSILPPFVLERLAVCSDCIWCTPTSDWVFLFIVSVSVKWRMIYSGKSGLWQGVYGYCREMRDSKQRLACLLETDEVFVYIE